MRLKLLKVKVRCRLTRKRSLVRIQSCLPFSSRTYAFRFHLDFPLPSAARSLIWYYARHFDGFVNRKNLIGRHIMDDLPDA